MDDDYSSDDDDLDDDDYEAFLNDTSEFLLEDLGVLFSDDGSSDYDAMLVDDADDNGSVINLATSDEGGDDDPFTMDDEEDDDDTESYYDTGASSSSPTATIDSRSDDETMDAATPAVVQSAATPAVVQSAATPAVVQSAVTPAVVQSAVTPAVVQSATTLASQEPTATTANTESAANTAVVQPPATTVEPSTSATRSSDGDDDDGQTCVICMEVWSNSGSHRLASLRCGHLFGQSCIARWLKVARARDQRRCPQCNLPASLRDVRPLYARKLIALDTAERDRLKERLDLVERERGRLDLELKKSVLAREQHERQLAELRCRLSEAPPPPPSQTVGVPLRISLQASVEVNKEGGCRVMAYSYPLKMVVVSQRSANNLFSGYGITKMNSLDFGRTQFVFLHTKQIRDLAFHPRDSVLLLSVSLDRCAKLLDMSSNSVVQSFQAEAPLWSCCWHADDPNLLYVGCQTGCVLEYDVRRGGGAVSRLDPRGLDVSPVASLACLGAGAGATLPRGGLLACHLNSCRCYPPPGPDGAREGTALPLDGPFVSLRYDRSIDQLLVSSRPSSRSLWSRNVVCELARGDGVGSVTCRPIRTLQGSTTQNLMSRPCIVRLPGGLGPAVASYQENQGAVTVWSVGDGRKVCSQAVREPVLDTCPIYVNDSHLLGTLSERMFNVYKLEAN